MAGFSRTDTSLIARWWWTIDRWNLTALIAIAGIGAVMALAASPPVAERIGLDTFYFVRRQFVYLLLGLFIMVGISMLSPRGLRRLAIMCLAGSMVLMVAVLFVGSEIKGASRWLHLGAFSLQPSEFVKPSFAVVAAWLFAQGRLDERFPGYMIASGLFVAIAALLLLQPDVGMTMVVAAIWGVQFFLAGLPLIFVAMVACVFIGGGVAAYFVFPHVQSRIDRFLDPAVGENYQVMRGIEAFQNGGLFGRGPGEGRVKEVLPDAHADFIFAVTGEEFGLIACLLIASLFAFVVFRGFSRVFKENNFFIMLVVIGLLIQFGLQAIINMASAVHLIPPKGMTLPFISYGGSSTLALAYAMGMVLALTREQPGGAR
ncbi:MAG: putative lipid II flippase FtsW [Rhodospirillales bacterium]